MLPSSVALPRPDRVVEMVLRSVQLLGDPRHNRARENLGLVACSIVTERRSHV